MQWYWSETRDAGDLRFRVGEQAYSALVILLALFFPGRYTRGSDFGLVLGFYALAKALEFFDSRYLQCSRPSVVILSNMLLPLQLASASYECCRYGSQSRGTSPAFAGNLRPTESDLN